MFSLDTNILVYAANSDCKEHLKANRLLNEALASPMDWMIADQVLLEYYKALRHPKILSKPLGANDAAAQIQFLRKESGFMVCCHELSHWDEIHSMLRNQSFPYQRTHDLMLGVTLKRNGVKTFFTRNTKDFSDIGFNHLINPIDAEQE